MNDTFGCLCFLDPGACPEHPQPPIVFLDVDGVLNSEDWFSRWKSPEEFDAALRAEADWKLAHLDPEAVARLRSLVLDTGARIVVSSTWRHTQGGVPRLLDLLAKRGFPEARELTIGQTPVRHGRPRAEEIGEWLDEHCPNHRPPFVILDDGLSACLVGHFVHCTYEHGLDDAKVAEARAILGAP